MDIEEKVEAMMEQIDDEGAPEKMTKREWREYLEYLSEAIGSRLEAAKDDQER